MTQSSFIKINPADTVVVCLRPFKQGETIDVDGHTVTVKQDVPAGHKVLIVDTPQGKDTSSSTAIPSAMHAKT